MIFSILRKWKQGGGETESRMYTVDARSLADGSVIVRISLRHEMAGRKFKVEHDVTILPQEDEQKLLTTFVERLQAEYDASMKAGAASFKQSGEVDPSS